jgi:hypothetical protein
MRDQLWKNGCEIDVSSFSMKRRVGWMKSASKAMETKACKAQNMLIVDQGRRKAKTYDCAEDLEPEAFPPDLPPVILNVIWMELIVECGRRWRVDREALKLMERCCCDGSWVGERSRRER